MQSTICDNVKQGKKKIEIDLELNPLIMRQFFGEADLSLRLDALFVVV